MKLQYLTLNKIVDTAYFCGIDGTPVSVLIAAPSGAGKSWSTSAVANTDFVQYIGKVYSPNEHRAIIGKNASRTRLLINDDLGLTARWNQVEYYSTFCMIHDGELMFKVFRQTQHVSTTCSMILCCTLDYFYSHRDDMSGMGLLDRVVPVILRLSNETRREYQEYEMKGNIMDSKPAPRNPSFLDVRKPKVDMVLKKNIDPRLLRNLRRMSQYLTEEETEELIEVAHSNGKYEI